MGEGGKITLVNGTKYDWVRTYQHHYQMDQWDFPEQILSGKTATIYVEWDQFIFHTESDDSGEVTYELKDCNHSFQVQARAKDKFNIQVELRNIETQGNPKNTTISLGWVHNGYVTFVLSGESGRFTSTNIPGHWMQSNLNVLGDKTLHQLCIPGSHDAGMSTRASGTPGGADCNTLTQSKNILGQLECGIRYFDLRPAIGGGNQLLTGHYSKINNLSWQGANGESIQSIIDGINTYTASHKELIILNLSHSLNTEEGNTSYRPFNQSEWNRLLAQLSDVNHGIKNLFVAPDPINVDLTRLTLNTFISDRPAVVVVIEETMDLCEYAKKGFYKYKNLRVYNKYSNTNELDSMSRDQFEKMNTQKNKSDAELFLLSWTLTQSSTQAVACVGGLANSIRDLADIANPALYDMLLPHCHNKCYPNILYIDNVKDSNIAALAMAVNSISN